MVRKWKVVIQCATTKQSAAYTSIVAQFSKGTEPQFVREMLSTAHDIYIKGNTNNKAVGINQAKREKEGRVVGGLQHVV